ncbi:aminopeptidase P family protein [Candidatus Woesearchaeota archaeon]|nr:aminopeptidase P family protein [Candidatus Woesearchaeota archaeon]
MNKEKLQEFQALLKKEKIDAALLINTTIKDPNVFYWTGLELEYSFLMIPKDKEPIFLVSALEYQRAKKYSQIQNVKEYKKPLEEIAKMLGKNKTVAINNSRITLALFKGLKKHFKNAKYKDAESLMRKIRITKTKEEISALQEAAKIADQIFKDLCQELKTNRAAYKTEKDIAEFIEQRVRNYNTIPSFETIVASGKNAAMPHYMPQQIPLQRGFCVLDFGVKYKNYISDISRTIFFGIPTREEKTAYKKVYDANARGIAATKIGKKASDIDKISRKEFNYPHSLGHGIGVEVHEAPNISPKSKDKIEENMCFTIEPGMYIPNKLGIRIEDDLWITKSGPILLTKSTKELLCFE